MQDVLPDAQKIVSLPPFPSLPAAMVQLLAAKVLTITPAEAQAFLMGTTLENIAEPVRPALLPKPAAERAKPAAAPRRPKAALAPTPAAPPPGEKFTLSQGILQATAYLHPDGSLLVQAGSRAALAAATSLEAPAQRLREELVASGELLPEGDYLVFTKDYLFKSANLAARIIVARSVNAQITWKHATGKQVRDFLK